MTQAQLGDQVVMAYTVKTSKGEIVGSSESDGPLTLVLGSGTIFPPVEDALVGMAVTDETTVTVSPNDAFGPRREDLMVEIPREHLPQDLTPQPGMQLKAQAPDSEPVILTIVKVGEAKVLADGNHPLAGEELHFSLTVLDVTPKSAEG